MATIGTGSNNGSPNLTLFNTMTKSKEVFSPIKPPKVSLYVCGVTVYDYSHLGHARAYVSFDLLYRLLRHLGYEVNYIRNFTDIDDKIIKRASEINSSVQSLSERFIQEFSSDMEALRCSPPSKEPKATEYIPVMIKMIKNILDNGHGYEIDGDVFFDTASVSDYGRLSKRGGEDNRPGSRVAVNDRKKSPADFVLWKSAVEGEPAWDSPWGPGRPGWHIECSAMTRELIGPVVDIHGGGSDLVFPHHENELAQNQAAAAPCDKEVLINGRDFVKYWVHNGFVNIEDEKMSKSVGNFFTIREVLEDHHPLALRWMLLSVQYRQPLNYSERVIEKAEQDVYYLCQTLSEAKGVLKKDPGGKEEGMEQELAEEVIQGLCDDINSPVALSVVYGCLSGINELIKGKKGKKDKDRYKKLRRSCQAVSWCMRLMGFDVDNPDKVIEEMKRLLLKRVGIEEEYVMKCIGDRDKARAEKDYAKADAIREELTKLGIAMCDDPEGTTWRPL